MAAPARSSLREWFRRHTIIPLVIGHGIVILVGLFFSIVVVLNDRALQDTAVEDFLQVVPRAIAQQNRPMLEALLLSFGQRVQAIGVGICQKDREMLSLMQRGTYCLNREIEVPLLHEVRRMPMLGSADHTVFFVVPRFARLPELCLIFIGAFLMIILNTVILRNVSRGLRRDLINPLQGSRLDEVKISEIFSLLKTKEEAAELRTQMAVSEAIREVAKQVAHDIRSPLSALKILVQKTSGLKADEKEMLSTVADRINLIAEDLLRKEKRANQKVDISRALYEVFQEKKLEIEGSARAVQLTLLAPKLKGVNVIGDESRFKRILSNLLNNSVEAMENEGSISITGEVEENFVSVTVWDNGRGISRSVLEQIAASSVTTKSDGHGIGLSSAIAHIRAWGGSVDVSSVEKVGTQIKLLLPKSMTC